MIFFNQGVTPLLALTLTSHLHLRRSETPIETNSGYATDLAGKSVGVKLGGRPARQWLDGAKEWTELNSNETWRIEDQEHYIIMIISDIGSGKGFRLHT